MNVFKHTAMVTTAVHDELISWARNLLIDAGLDVVDVHGRFPPEGTTRSHVVMFPYRVGPDPRMIDNSKMVSLFASPGRREARGLSVPPEWSDLGALMSRHLGTLYPDVSTPDPAKDARRDTHPYPRIDTLPAPLKAWYEAQKDAGDAWVIEADGLRASPPSLTWRNGIIVGAYYLVMAGDPGRGTSAASTSDTAPLSLAALSVLSMGIQAYRELTVELPERPVDERIFSFAEAFAASLALDEEHAADGERLGQLAKVIGAKAVGRFQILPVHDLNNQEFALLTQALQRPLQAVLNIHLRIPVGAGATFGPSSQVVVSARNAKEENAAK